MSPDEIAQVDEQLSRWQQGDVVLTDALPAVHLAHMAAPGTPASEELAAMLNAEGVTPDFAAISSPDAGFMVVSQTCDIVRTCADRPYVEVCPLQLIDANIMPLVRLGRISRYAWASGIGEANLGADLERVTTLEKATLARFGAERRPGVQAEAEARTLAETLGGKRSRAALPDDFTKLVKPLQRRIVERHNKATDEGRFLRALREIRVIAKPAWQAASIEVELLFLFHSISIIPAKAEEQAESLAGRVTVHGRYSSVSARVISLDTLSAAAYVGSDKLDLDHLSAAHV